MQTYTGGCHCGKVRYEAKVNLASVVLCNCSHCTKKGLLLKFIPATFFTLIEGDESTLIDYQFNRKHIHHLSCPVCGVQSYARGSGANGIEMVAINVRCLDEVDTDTIPVTKFDGKKW